VQVSEPRSHVTCAESGWKKRGDRQETVDDLFCGDRNLDLLAAPQDGVCRKKFLLFQGRWLGDGYPRFRHCAFRVLRHSRVDRAQDELAQNWTLETTIHLLNPFLHYAGTSILETSGASSTLRIIRLSYFSAGVPESGNVDHSQLMGDKADRGSQHSQSIPDAALEIDGRGFLKVLRWA